MQIFWRKFAKNGFRTKDKFKSGKEIEFNFITTICFPKNFRKKVF